MDPHVRLKECLLGLVASEAPVREEMHYGGVLVETTHGPKCAYLRLSFEDPPQMLEAVGIVLSLADAATEGDGMASELRLGPEAIKLIVSLRDAIKARNSPPPVDTPHPPR